MPDPNWYLKSFSHFGSVPRLRACHDTFDRLLSTGILKGFLIKSSTCNDQQSSAHVSCNLMQPTELFPLATLHLLSHLNHRCLRPEFAKQRHATHRCVPRKNEEVLLSDRKQSSPVTPATHNPRHVEIFKQFSSKPSLRSPYLTLKPENRRLVGP